MSWLCQIGPDWNEPRGGGTGEARAGRDRRGHHFSFSLSRRGEARSEEPVLVSAWQGGPRLIGQCLRVLGQADPWLGTRGRAEGSCAPQLLVTLRPAVSVFPLPHLFVMTFSLKTERGGRETSVLFLYSCVIIIPQLRASTMYSYGA